MTLSNPADAIDVAHRLLAASRDLVRRQRLFVEALEEVLLWLPRPEGGQVLNGRTIAHNIGDCVIEEAGYGEGRSLAMRTGEVTAPAVLLQPGLPADLGEVDRALPHLSRAVVAGLRRRSWRQHVANLHRREGVPQPASPSDDGMDLVTETFTDLYLVQATPNQTVNAPDGCAPFPQLPRRGQTNHRRRLHAPRPEPRLRDGPGRAAGSGQHPSRSPTEPSGPASRTEPSAREGRSAARRGIRSSETAEGAPDLREPVRRESSSREFSSRARSRSRDL